MALIDKITKRNARDKQTNTTNRQNERNGAQL